MELEIRKPIKKQQQQNQGNIESLHTSSSTLCSFIPATPNWTNAAIIGEHLWNETTSNETCYIDESECTKCGAKRKCSVCHIVCHVNCLPLVQVSCRPTFREAFIHDYRTEKTYTTHHWIKRRKQNKKCKQCGKSLQSILGFSSKEYITIQCTWCKIGYHNKSSCFRESYLTEPCSLGSYSDLIVPPDWIIKLTERNDYKLPSSSSSTSICRSSSFVTPSCLSNCDKNINQIRSLISRPNSLDHSNHIINNNNNSIISDQLSSKTSITTVHEDIQPISISQANIYIEPKISFVIKTNPINTASLKPLLVFLNPKSGGNQGVNLLKKFQWLLNPRQVFDVSKGGPKMGLELFSRVPNLRILVCGGDGTVGWIFSTIDSMNFNTIPPVAVLPLGTGNDLARALNWGSGYIDESVSKVLNSVYEGRVIALDRWQVNSEVRTDFQTTQQLTDYEDDDSTRNRPISDVLPLKVFNNYFSLGADAATALQFHESREANPEKFNSRLKNKLFYAGLGGKDLLRRSWRDLSEHITLICDDKDLTPLIHSLKPHCILFLNIPRYGSGTLPWGQPTTEFQPQRIDDGYIEVIGLTSTSLATLQIGGHGDRICQCRRVHLTTDIVIPMQMDGEPCRLMPSKIDIFCSHQALVIQKLTRSPISAVMSNEDENHLQWKTIGYETRINVFVIALKDYDKMSDDVISLRQTAIWIGIITAKYDTDLSTVRKIITQLNNDTTQNNLYNENYETMETNLKFRVHLSDSWVFIDSTTAASQFFRIDKEQENVHFLTDVCNMEDLFLIDSILESHLTYNNPTTDSFMDDNVLHPLASTSLLRDGDDNQLNQFGAKASNLTESDNQNENDDDDDDSIDDGDNDYDCMNKTQSKNLIISTNNTSLEGEILIPNDDMIHSTSYLINVLNKEFSGDKQEQIETQTDNINNNPINLYQENRFIYTIYEMNKSDHNTTNNDDGSSSSSSSSSSSIASSSIQNTSNTLTTNYSTIILLNDNSNNIIIDSSLLHKNRQQRDLMFTTNDLIELVTSDSEIIMKQKTESRIQQDKDNLTNESSNNTIEIQIISSDEDPIHDDGDVDDDNDINVTTLIQEINNLSLKSKNYHSNQKFEKLLLPNISKQLQYYLNKALLRASHNGLIDLVELLLNAGANIHALDKYGRSCLHLAAKFGHVKVIEHLLKYIPEKLIDLQEYEKNQTALHKAAASRRRVVCKILITAGACPTITDIYGKQPSNLALKANDPQLATYLKREEIFFIITNGVEKVDV
ncbi:unnamed protein product [Schistosoma rodhaini]|uniref:Diacylglycerol kinase n=1 Tax=Schistosoma rodhaini TaxID=6188 RepID=A0AA85GBW0_9TREM|nr:unnamed protein product [Schistosoma rodhaini]